MVSNQPGVYVNTETMWYQTNQEFVPVQTHVDSNLPGVCAFREQGDTKLIKILCQYRDNVVSN